MRVQIDRAVSGAAWDEDMLVVCRIQDLTDAERVVLNLLVMPLDADLAIDMSTAIPLPYLERLD